MPHIPDDITLSQARALDRRGSLDRAVQPMLARTSVISQLARVLARQSAREWLQENSKEMERVR